MVLSNLSGTKPSSELESIGGVCRERKEGRREGGREGGEEVKKGERWRERERKGWEREGGKEGWIDG